MGDPFWLSKLWRPVKAVHLGKLAFHRCAREQVDDSNHEAHKLIWLVTTRASEMTVTIIIIIMDIISIIFILWALCK